MSVWVALVVGLVGGLGSIGRFALDGAVAMRLGRRFPYGTLAVNLSGSLALGVVVGASVRGDGYEILGTGLVGAYTTFSTWALESHRLGEDGELRSGWLNFALSVVFGVVVTWLGRHLGGAL